jgi:hypothetical protein
MVARSLVELLAAEETVREQSDQQLLVSGLVRCAPNRIWREKVTQWFYDVADHLHENRSIVYVAINMLDRYCTDCAQKLKPMDERDYEVSSLASIYLAVRISGPEELRLQDLLHMTRGGVTMREIVATGTDMIKSLKWDHRIVTPYDFLGALLDILPSSSRRSSVLDSATYIIELSVCDISLSHLKASDIALAAVLNGLGRSPVNDVEDFVKSLKTLTDIDPTNQGIASLRNRLHRLYCLSYDSQQSNGPHVIIDEDEDMEDTSWTSTISTRISQDDLLQADHPMPRTERANSNLSQLC